MEWQTEKLETRRVEEAAPVTLSFEEDRIVGRFRDEEMFRVAGDVFRAETRRKVLSALRAGDAAPSAARRRGGNRRAGHRRRLRRARPGGTRPSRTCDKA